MDGRFNQSIDSSASRAIQYELQGTVFPCTRCVFQTGYLMYGQYGNIKGETKRISRDRIIVINLEEKKEHEYEEKKAQTRPNWH